MANINESIQRYRESAGDTAHAARTVAMFERIRTHISSVAFAENPIVDVDAIAAQLTVAAISMHSS